MSLLSSNMLYTTYSGEPVLEFPNPSIYVLEN